jgi:ribose transport system substrate-binding protein
MKRASILVGLTLTVGALAPIAAGSAWAGQGQTATSNRTATAQKAGQQAAKAAGKKVAAPKIKVGFLQILGAIESAQRAERAFRSAAKVLGWTVVSCDAQGDPTKMARCTDSLLDQNVKAVIDLGVEPSILKAQLRKAKSKGVPVVEFSGQVAPDPLLSGAYYPDEAKGGKVLTDYLVKRLDSLPGGTVDIAVHDYPAQWATARTDTLKAAVKGDSKLKISTTSITDATNLVEGTRKTVSDQLTANPDLKAFWFAFDSAGQAGGPAIQAKDPGKSFPDKPLVATFHADLGTVELMRSGAIDVVSDWPYDASAWVAADQLAEFLARKKAFSKSPRPVYPGIGDTLDYAIVTKDNLPPKGKYRTTKYDYETFFKTKWTNEFNGLKK